MKPDQTPDISLSDCPTEFRTRLLAWFDRKGRSLPWRRCRSLYGTWISEMMLQQTTVVTVIPYWERFMEAFGDVTSLAAAPLDEVLKMWSGLGYYRRARQLHQAAKILVEEKCGQLPHDREGWLQLPGIGPYASGAIASIGLHQRVPALDANARRVLTRWLVGTPRGLAKLRPAQLENVGEELVDPDRPGDWNEAVMELGALVCRASGPACAECPVRDLCRAGPAGMAHLIPPPRMAKAVQRVWVGVLVLAWEDRILLVPPASGPAVVPAGSPAPARNDFSGLHKGLWGLPSTAWLPDPGDKKAGWPGTIWLPLLEAYFGAELCPGRQEPVVLGDFRHAITRYRLRVQVYGLRLQDPSPGKARFRTQPSMTSSQSGVLVSGAGTEPRPPRARFSPWPVTDQPVSNLVKKSLLVAESRQV